MPAELFATPLAGVWEIHSHSFSDHRGSFLNAFRLHETSFQQAWGERTIHQVNISRTESAGVVRGLHFQKQPFSEAKLVRCLRGCVWDVAVDLRVDSPSYGAWHSIKLNSTNGNSLLIPEGCAHGFQVIESGSELLYLHSAPWVPDSETGVRWDDPYLAVKWPLPVTGMSSRDLNLPFLNF